MAKGDSRRARWQRVTQGESVGKGDSKRARWQR